MNVSINKYKLKYKYKNKHKYKYKLREIRVIYVQVLLQKKDLARLVQHQRVSRSFCLKYKIYIYNQRELREF